MNQRIQVIAVVGSLLVMLLVFDLIRRRKLREEYAFIWFGASLLLIGVSTWRDSLEVLAALTGVAYPPSVLLLAMLLVGFFLALHYAVSLSRLAEQNKRLAQEVALLRHELEARASADGPPAPPAEQAGALVSASTPAVGTGSPHRGAPPAPGAGSAQ